MSFIGFKLTKEDIESFERLYKKLHQKQQDYMNSEITHALVDDAVTWGGGNLRRNLNNRYPIGLVIGERNEN